jgi:hypothetical protein
MIEFLNLMRESFPLYFRMMYAAPSLLIEGWQGTGAATLIFLLILAIAIIFLCERQVRKRELEFTLGVIFTTLVLSLTVVLIGLLMSILSSGNVLFPVAIVGCDSPVLNIVLGVLVVLSSQLKNNFRKAGIVILYGAGFLFAWALAATTIIFFYALYNY